MSNVAQSIVDGVSYLRDLLRKKPEEKPQQEALRMVKGQRTPKKDENDPVQELAQMGFRFINRGGENGSKMLMFYDVHANDIVRVRKVEPTYFVPEADGGQGWDMEEPYAHYVDPGSEAIYLLVRCSSGPNLWVRILSPTSDTKDLPSLNIRGYLRRR